MGFAAPLAIAAAPKIAGFAADKIFGGGGGGGDGAKSGGLFGPSITTMPTNSQASPLANDVLTLLEQQIANGEFGAGATSLQREAGTAMRQFANSGGPKFDFGGDFMANPFEGLGLDFSKVPGSVSMSDVRNVGAVRDVGPMSGIRDITSGPGFSPLDMTRTNFGSVNTTGSNFREIDQRLMPIRDVPGNVPLGVRDVNVDLGPASATLANMIPSLMQISQMQTDRSVGDLRESMGIAGTRFGSALTRGEADLRAQAGANLNATMAQLLPQIDAARRSDAALKLEGQNMGIQRDISLNNVLSNLLQLGVQRDTAMADQGLNLQSLGLQRDQAAAQDNQFMRDLDLRKLLGASNEGLSLQGLLLDRDKAINADNLGRQSLGVQRDTSLGDLGARLQQMGIQRDLDLSSLGINRDLGVQGNTLQRDLTLADLFQNQAIAGGQFNLDRTTRGQADNLARTGLRADMFNTDLNRQLEAIFGMQEAGNQNIAPFLQLALAGINPDTQVVRDSGLKTGIDSAAGLLSGLGALGGTKGIPGLVESISKLF